LNSLLLDAPTDWREAAGGHPFAFACACSRGCG